MADVTTPHGRTWMLEGTTKRSSVKVARAIVRPDYGQIPVRLLNPRDKPSTIYAGTVLARLEEVDEPESVNAVIEKREATGKPAELETTLWNLACNVDVPLSAAEQEQMFSLLMEYSDIFAGDAKDFGQTNKVCHKIFTGDAAPMAIRQQIRRIPPSRKEETKKLVQEMLDSK